MMNTMHFKGLDLNLLVAFSALMRHRNVTRAAEDIRITQAALSHALVRLRNHYTDPLFVRAKGAMHPTPRAMEIAGSIDLALQKVGDTFLRDFDHTELRRTFRIGLVDYAAAFLLPALMERVGNDAPHVQIAAEHMTFGGVRRVIGTPEMDFAIGLIPSAPPACQRELLFAEKFGVMVRQQHPEIKGRLTPAQYARLRHVNVPLYRGIDRTLRRAGCHRTFAITSENILTVPFIVARSNLLATVPSGFARVFSDFCKLRIFEPPFKLEAYRVQLLWHRRFQGDAAHAWFAGIIRSIASDLRRDLLMAG